MMLMQSPKTLEGKLVFGFLMLPWAPKRPWTLKDGPGTRSGNHHGKHFYGNYSVLGTILRALCKITPSILTTVRSWFYYYSPFIDEETEAELQISYALGQVIWWTCLGTGATLKQKDFCSQKCETGVEGDHAAAE